MKFTVYSRGCCVLCEEMVGGLRHMQHDWRFAMDVIDVDSDPALAQRYGENVPVLACGEREICRHFLQHDAVTAFLAEIR